MDYRVWLAWHGATNRIYVAVERSGDIYINKFEYGGRIATCFLMMEHDSSVSFIIDGDASGGKYAFHGNEIDDKEERRLWTNQHAQKYYVLAELFGVGPHICLPAQSLYDDEDWFQRPPYAEGGGTSFGAQPTISVIEFYVTPFDRLIWNSPEESVVSSLSPGTLIGFFLSIPDHDTGVGEHESWPFLAGYDPARGLLVGPGGEIPDSAVESVTWGRLKATVVR